jgi:hypothetical protein
VTTITTERTCTRCGAKLGPERRWCKAYIWGAGMTTDALPNFREAKLRDVWAYRQEWHEQEVYAQRRRLHADKEITVRMGRTDRIAITLESGRSAFITAESEMAYDPLVVDGAFMALIARDELYAEFLKFARRNYKINRNWLKRLKKRGQEYANIIDNRMAIAATGSLQFTGPSLSALGGYAPREDEE